MRLRGKLKRISNAAKFAMVHYAIAHVPQGMEMIPVGKQQVSGVLIAR